MAFDALEVALSVIPLIAGHLEKIARRDRDLARQIRRATHSFPQNIAEGRERKGGDRLYHYTVAFGSTAEVVTSLRIALGFGYVEAADIAAPLAELDRVRAMLWRLTH